MRSIGLARRDLSRGRIADIQPTSSIVVTAAGNKRGYLLALQHTMYRGEDLPLIQISNDVQRMQRAGNAITSFAPSISPTVLLVAHQETPRQSRLTA